jgi:NTP pyrophosphatase (non-canonical NTP hydrolase)
MELNDYQELANRTDQRPLGDGDDEMAVVYPLMGMASEVGSLLTEYKKYVRDGDAHKLFGRRVAEELGDILWYVSNLAAKLDLDLDAVATLNLERISERWPAEGEERPARLLDDDYPPGEKLPRQVTVRFVEEGSDPVRVRLFRGEEQLGDELTDMNYDPDGYRFHDVFHLSYTALLGWSPVSRYFFKTKRESVPAVREIEDGGRAVVIEEAVAASAFEYARSRNYLENVDHIDSVLLYNIKGLVSRFEVRVRTLRDWEQAILRSFEVWRELREHRGGSVKLDLEARTIEFQPPRD